VKVIAANDAINVPDMSVMVNAPEMSLIRPR